MGQRSCPAGQNSDVSGQNSDGRGGGAYATRSARTAPAPYTPNFFIRHRNVFRFIASRRAAWAWLPPKCWRTWRM
jgi:hypothetical protein